ncbi:MAG TPA: chemotaxis protein CheX [Gemmatimonadales bacterium]|nr:chemotaxis protein CheX [Gemmatimonadales bacterium]
MDAMEDYNRAIGRIVEAVWPALLQLEGRADPAGGRTVSESGTPAPAMTGRVRFAGARRGVVLLRCPAPLARRTAAAMFGIDVDAAGEPELRDAVGELVNITAGNLKPLLPAGCELSLPLVTTANPPPAGRVLAEAGITVGGERLTVTLVEDAEP